MTMNRLRPLLIAAGLCATAAHAVPIAGQGNWQTQLHARNLQGHAVALDSAAAVFFYDSLLDVTWLRQAGPAQTWGQAQAWADGLTVGGYSDWRLPKVVDTGLPGCSRVTYSGGDCGYNVPQQAGGQYSELAYLFHATLGNESAYTTTGTFRGFEGQGTTWGLANTGGFEGLRTDIVNWSGSTVTGGASYAWSFHLGLGSQMISEKGVQGQALALRSGDVLSPVPEPSALLMMSLGVMGLLLRRRVRR